MEEGRKSVGEGKLVCVTGASGYIASWLVKLLLLRGYSVNATVRDPNGKFIHNSNATGDPNKVEHLLALEGAKERLHLFKAELTDEDSFDDAVSGCDGVFHTASPCFFVSDDPQAELLDPAIKGTINVLSSCGKFPSVKRVVLTSSLAAIGRGKHIAPEDVIDESWFSDPEVCRESKRWYALSKTLAEEAAWKYAKDKGIDLVSINPGYVIGPLLQPKLNESSAIFLNLIKAKAYSDDVYEVVDIRDVANAHILAFEKVSANGRYCLVESIVRSSEILKILRELYPTLQLPDKCENDNLDVVICHISKEKAKGLGIDFIPFRTSLKEMIESLKEKKLISF